MPRRIQVRRGPPLMRNQTIKPFLPSGQPGDGADEKAVYGDRPRVRGDGLANEAPTVHNKPNLSFISLR